MLKEQRDLRLARQTRTHPHETCNIMRSSYIFLLLYLLWGCFVPSSQQGEARCNSTGQDPDATSCFLQCVGSPASNTGRDHMRTLKTMLEAAIDIYTFMRSSVKGAHLSLEGAIFLDPDAEPLHNEALVEMWMEVKVAPLLKSINRHVLACLSNKNFSCSTYQTMVKELSRHFYEMNPARQKWIYSFFMYPFLSRNGVAGCVNPNESSEEWLMKNFGAFNIMARINDFPALNMVFSGLEVLHLLSPAQKAELLLRPEVAGLSKDSLSLIFHSLMSDGPPANTTNNYEGIHNWTEPEYPQTTYSPYLPPSPHNTLTEVIEGTRMAFQPIMSFVHNFVTFTRRRHVSGIRSSTLMQFLLNWTLAEMASHYRPYYSPVPLEVPELDEMKDWYRHVVLPILRRFSSDEQSLMSDHLLLAFRHVFNLDHNVDNGTVDIQDVCSVALDGNPCGLTDAVGNVARIMHCAARTNLTMSEGNIMRLILELTEHLNLLIQEFVTANFTEVASDFRQIFSEADSHSFTQDNLHDPEFVTIWFHIKLSPLLPHIPADLLSCLSANNFSCPAYQTLVALLSQHMSYFEPLSRHHQNIYTHFVYFFLRRHNMSDACFSANNSTEWLWKNFGSFSHVADIADFYDLNPNFSGLEVLDQLSPRQTAQLMLLAPLTPPEKDDMIREVFDFLVEFPRESRLLEVLHALLLLATEVQPPCAVSQTILEQLQRVIVSVPPDMEFLVRDQVDQVIQYTPKECVSDNIKCLVIQINATDVCKGINSSDLHLALSTSVDIPCNFTLEDYACSQLQNFTANQLASLLSCNLTGNSKRSRVLWKILLSHLSPILDPALDMLSSIPGNTIGPSAPEILDVIGETRVALLSDEQLRNSSVIARWFSGRLKGFLPFASDNFLRCLSYRNLSCQSYQEILEIFKQHYVNITHTRRIGILQQFVVNFLSGAVSGPSCLSGFKSSTEWLIVNVGPFSQFLTLEEILQLNPDFNPLEALPLLSLRQRLDLLFTPSPGLPEIDVIIDAVLDHLTNSPKERLKIPEFLTHLVGRLQPPVNGNLSCSSYKMLFTRLDLALQTVPLHVMSSITSSKLDLAELLPPGCVIYSGECTVTPINATEICMAVNSTALQLLLDNGTHEGRLCNFAVEQFACASLSPLTDQDLAVIFTCNTSGHLPFWKLLLTKSSHLLNESLDLLTNTTFNPGNSAASVILDAIREIQLDTFPGAFVNDLELWFKHRLRPFLHAASPDFLSCLTTKDLNCTSYQHIVQALSHVQPNMSIAAQTSVVSHFIKIFLTRNNTDDPSCITHSSNSSEWLKLNFGAFSHLLLLREFQMLHPSFSPFEALPQLTVRQLADLSSTPGALTSPAQVAMVMEHVPNQSLPTFFDDFSPSIKGKESFYPAPVRSALLEVVFDRASLSQPSVRDSVVSSWLRVRLPPLLFQLSPRHVSPFFQILSAKNCSVERQGIKELNTTISSLSNQTQKETHNHIVQALKGPIPLRCYANNQSYYDFLQSSFLGFQLPNLTTFLSLIPQNKRNQLVNSVAPSELGSYLRQPDIVDDDAELCSIFGNYLETPSFLEKETLPVAVRRPTLPCVWPLALGSSSRSEVKAWFDRRIVNYLNFLTKDLIGNVTTYNTSCLAFQEFVSVLGLFNFSAVDFVRRDVFDTITIYLNSASAPKCYNASDPELNSTAWFAEYIGPFVEFITLQDFFTFGSPEVLQLFTVDQQNIAIFNQTVLPVNVVNYYTELLYKQDSNFNPIFLPLPFRCFVPGMAFSQLSADESMLVLHNLTTLCVDLDPQVAAALAGNLGDEIDAASIAALGKESAGISVGQIKTIDGKDLHEALGTLSNVTGWHLGQAKAIVLALMSSGLMQINNASSLLMLGSLILGVPANTFSNIDGSELITASKDPTFLMHLTTAPRIIQLVVVSQIISVNSSSDDVVENIPDDLATEIPGSLLLGVSSTEKVLTKLNKKKWKRKQAELLFEIVAVESATTLLGSADNLSSSVLQGFTCTSVRTFQKSQVKKLIRACRRKGRNKVKLAETQLTCMYNHIKDESDATSFELYPRDMLLYYNYSLVPQNSCRSYFEELAEADFSVFSSVLSSIPTVLFENAKSCLGITNQSLSENDISVLGNMCCTLDGIYISNSDASILGKLQNCSELSEGQVTALEALLESGNTTYGPPSNWTKETLEDLGTLPLFMTSNFYENFNRETKRSFLRDFLKVLKENGVDKQKRKSLKKEMRKSIRNKVKRSLENECTVGSITQVTISDEVFPFDYFDVNQFNCCLNATVVRDNLGSITEKVDQDEYLKIVLEKLREAYADHSSIPADQVELLGQASRQATSDDIILWNVTLVDTLSSLMDSSNGPWNSSLAKQIITKYLSHNGNMLGSTELNVIGGDNLCSLDANVLQGISAQSLRDASVLNVSICTPAKKQVLFIIALKAFGGTTRSTVSTAEYQFMEPYLGGAPLDYIRTLVNANINMNLETFVSLNPSAVMAMSVGDVRDLLGTNLPNIKRYENQELVREWIQSQRQSELNQLGVELQGGRADPTVAPTAITAEPNQPSSSTTQSSSGTRVSAKVDALFLLIILLFTSM
ncbi:uncharacterized protein LOC127613259 isoform X1 [Hippocampus zosterae]|uniref:uncharacterized protein LOC127613259 isoform X1 n=1 Tax=Hippocampus zosterae TaxID=109293 RepID=UPI00223E5428|nr:uncharacterized protein LOC127613259 isoform X1 [Hippocampus zosterae]